MRTAAGLGAALLLLLAWFGIRAIARWARRRKLTADDALTVLAAVVAAAFGAQGMWGFFRATLHLPVVLTGLGFTLFELVQLVCALRARRNMLADPEHGKAGPEGAMMWLFAGLAGFFSATHATTWAEGAFRLMVPSIAAWLWHRLMKLEHRQVAGRLAGINWRLTPERVLIKLGLADPTDRTAAEVSAERILMTLAIATRKARTPGRGRAWLAGRRLDAALQRATEYARLSTDATAQQLLVTTLGVLNGADSLKELQPPAPWATPNQADQAAPGVDLEKVYRDLIAADMLDVNDRTRALLGLSATVPTAHRPGWSPTRLAAVDDLIQFRPPGDPGDRPANRSDEDATAGQEPDLDLTATMRATILSANSRGVGEQKIADELGITRHRVRKFLRDQPGESQPVPVAVNGHDLNGDRS